MFTIAICTYNGEKNLPRVLDAILALHGYDELMDRVLVIDNASADSTRDIVERYQKISERMQYLYEHKQGLAHARRRAVIAQSEWVIYIDDDNVLDTEWLVELQKVIVANPGAGVINGAVIACPTDTLDEQEEARFKLMYRNLACTHLYEWTPNVPVNREPIGAGMCIRTDLLKKVDQSGWLALEGRKGKELSSGEDTELANRAMAYGYTYVCDYRMRMLHLIPKGRLAAQYTERLLKGLMNGWYDVISQRKHYVLERLIRVLKYGLVYIRCRIKGARPAKDIDQAEKNRIDAVSATAFLQRVKADKLFDR